MALACGRLAPVHVEIAGIDRRRPVLQDVPPPTVVWRRHRHVVWDYVHYLAEAGHPKGALECLVALLAPELFVDSRRVHNVVAMRAPPGGLQHRREVDVAHSQLRKVRRDLRSVGEAEAGVQLEPVGCPHHGPPAGPPPARVGLPPRLPAVGFDALSYLLAAGFDTLGRLLSRGFALFAGAGDCLGLLARTAASSSLLACTAGGSSLYPAEAGSLLSSQLPTPRAPSGRRARLAG